MPSIINSDDGVVSGSSGLKSTGGNDGILVFQSSGTETARITSGVLAVAATSTTASTVRLYEDTDNGANYVDLVAPTSVASNRVITLPDATTTVVGTDTTQTLTNKTLTSPTIGGTPVVNGSLIVSGTAQPASGSSVTFTGIPSWVKRIMVVFNGVNTTGTNNVLVRVGAGSVATSGYSSVSTYSTGAGGSQATSTAGMILTDAAANASRVGILTLATMGSNVWVASHSMSDTSNGSFFGAGSITLGGTLDRVSITTADTFAAGTINIIYE